MKNYVLVLFLFFSITGFAQQNKVELLQKKLNSYVEEDTVKALIYIDLADLLVFSEIDKSEGFAEKGLVLSKKLNWQRGIAAAYKSIGNVLFQRGSFVPALENWQQSLAIAEKENHMQLAASVVGNIGLVYQQMRDYKKAIEYQERKLKMIAPFNNKVEIANSHVNLGNAYTAMQDFETALKHYQAGLKLAEELNNPRIKGFCLNAMGMVNKHKKEYKIAIKYLNDALVEAEIAKDVSLIGYIKNNLSLLYLTEKEYEKSKALNDEALLIAKNTKNKKLESEGYQNKAALYSEKDDYKKALQSYIDHKKISDSLAGDEKNKQIARREVQFEADKKQAIADEEIKNQKQLKNYSIIGLIILLFAATGIFIFYKKHRDSIQKQNELVYKAKVADTDMRILRLQMNPHFIFNSLNSISDYISKNDIQSADYYLSKFAKLMRGILENSEEKEIPLEDELKMLELYMQLEGSRLKTKFTYEIKISDNVNPKVTLIPPLILQPFVENSIWHGLAGQDGGGKITIEVTRDNTLLNCIVEDNGVGRKGAKPNVGKSYGMKITKDRIELLNKLKNSNASVNLIDLEKGTRVEVKLPFETEV